MHDEMFAFMVQRQGLLLKGSVEDEFRYNSLSRFCSVLMVPINITRFFCQIIVILPLGLIQKSADIDIIYNKLTG